MGLSKITNTELREKVKQRKIAEEKPKMKIDNIVTPLSKNMTKLKELCQKYVDMMANECQFKNAEECIFEVALELFYGKEIWSWVRKIKVRKRQDELELIKENSNELA